MANIERVYNVPLRKEYQKAPKYKRAKKAVTALKEFLEKHMKSDNIKLGKFVNELIWKHGIKNPPHHVKIHVLKDEDNVVYAELEGKPLPLPKKEKEEKQESGVKEKLAALKKKVQEKPKEEKKPVEVKTKTALEEKKEEPKTEEKKPKQEKPAEEKEKPKEEKKPEPKTEKQAEKKETAPKKTEEKK